MEYVQGKTMDRSGWQTHSADGAFGRRTLFNRAAHEVLTVIDSLGGT